MVACCQLAWLHGAWCWLAATILLLRMNAATRSCWLVSTPASACQQLTSCGVQLLPETLYLTCSIIDRFLEKKGVLRKRLQLVRNQSGMLCGCLVWICWHSQLQQPHQIRPHALPSSREPVPSSAASDTRTKVCTCTTRSASHALYCSTSLV